MSMQQEKQSLLGSAPIGKLMAKLALPSIVAQVINILYNIVDRIYIGHIEEGSSLALTGLGICFPIITLISAFSAFAGAGGAPLAAIELGKSEYDAKAKEKANEILGNVIIMIIGFSLILSVFFYLFKEPILLAFGASENTLPFAKDYLEIYLIGTLFVQISIGLNPFISCQGFAKTAMASVIIGAVANIILDPIFIFGLNLGVRGAAFATVISQGISAIWIIRFLASKKSALPLSVKIIRFRPKIIGKISSLGISPFIMQSTESAIFVVFNSGLQKYGGDLYVGAMTIMQSIMQMCFVPLSGFTDGVQPILSYNYGAKKIDRVKDAIKKMLVISFSASIVMGVLVPLFPMQIARIFTSNIDLLLVTCQVLPIYFGAVWIFGIQMAAQRTFVGLGKAKTSLFIALLRKVILLIPLALILPNFIGVNGILWAEPIASTISAITSGIFLFFTYKELDKNQKNLQKL